MTSTTAKQEIYETPDPEIDYTAVNDELLAQAGRKNNTHLACISGGHTMETFTRVNPLPESTFLPMRGQHVNE